MQYKYKQATKTCLSSLRYKNTTYSHHNQGQHRHGQYNIRVNECMWYMYLTISATFAELKSCELEISDMLLRFKCLQIRKMQILHSFVFYVVFCRLLFVLFPFSFVHCSCLFLLDLQIPITTLVSSNTS